MLPKENLVLGLEGGVFLTKDLELAAEYATTAITQDTRAAEATEGGQGILGGIFNNRASTEYNSAYKVGLQYRFQQASLGVGYERIDPGYETLGAYFFNSDFENITVNVTSPFFDNKLNLGFNIGYQKDDLDNQKTNPTNRLVNASERLNITGSYSNFSTFTNVRANQFDNINDGNLLDNGIDTLNYRQISQNANLNINYVISNKKTAQQNLNLNYNVSDVANEQGGLVRIGDASTFHNISTAYTIGFQERNLNITPAINATYNTIGREEATTWGPTLSISKGYYENTFNTVLSSSYNTTTNTVGKVDIANIRAGISYVLFEKHNFSFNAVQLFRSGSTTPKLNEFTGTFSYNYSFDILKKRKKATKEKKVKKKRTKNKNEHIKINYKQYRFEGLPSGITDTIVNIVKQPYFGSIPSDKLLELKNLETKLVKATDKRENVYRENAITYLKSLEHLDVFRVKYQSLIAKAYHKLILEGEESDSRLEKEFIQLNAENNNSEFEKTPEFIEKLALVNKRYNAHKTMLSGLKTWNILEDSESILLKEFKDKSLNKIYKMHLENRNELEVIDFLEYRLADMYHTQMKK